MDLLGNPAVFLFFIIDYQPEGLYNAFVTQALLRKKERGMAEKEKRGGMTVREAGRKGGQTTSERHGPQFYEEIGRIGGQKVKRLIAAGKREEG
jgi:general stress protein YciG